MTTPLRRWSFDSSPTMAQTRHVNEGGAMGVIVKKQTQYNERGMRTHQTVEIDWLRFALAVAIFAVLLAVSIWVDWKNLVDDPSVYSGLAATALGAVLGFVAGEASGSSD